ncbi:LemA family protein [Acidithiobacillus ferrooxidans]|uniref:LemA family protein n=1 Tax=Acidithiobacillus ferrooxidans TaxID=920 RepID=UPI000B2FD176|nr:LemA family protein [Acidithiobacillus ferrooxidans]
MFGLFFFLILIAAGFVIMAIRSYNGLQGMGQEVKENHSNIMAAMKKRSDLINQLISVVSGYADHEKLAQITISNNQTAITEAAGLYQQGSNALGRIQAIAASFPELKANVSYQMLIGEISKVEDTLQERREKYNSVVRRYNSTRVQFPHALWAAKLGFPEAPYFDVENADELINLKNFQTDDGAMLRQMMSATTARISHGVSSGASRISSGAGKIMEGAKNARKEQTTNDPLAPVPVEVQAGAGAEPKLSTRTTTGSVRAAEAPMQSQGLEELEE